MFDSHVLRRYDCIRPHRCVRSSVDETEERRPDETDETDETEDPTSRTVCASGRTNRTEQISAARTAYSARPQHRSSCDGQREGSSDGGIQIVV